MTDKQITNCTVYPVFPSILTKLREKICAIKTDKQNGTVSLINGFMTAIISVKTGLLKTIENHLTGQKFALLDDCIALSLCTNTSDTDVQWNADDANFTNIKFAETAREVSVKLEGQIAKNKIAVIYKLRSNWFWLERHVEIEPQGNTTPMLKEIVYGKLAINDGIEKVLPLGQFDRPRLITIGTGGLFAGVGWWFYNVDNNDIYHNNAMYPLSEPYSSEPWYIGVFKAEQGEPYHGWLWYKTYLHIKKENTDKQTWYAEWNAGWGQWGLNIEEESTKPYIGLAHKFGIKTFLVGGGIYGYGTPRYAELAKTSDVAQANIAELKKHGITWGCLENGGRGDGWASTEQMQAAYEILDECVKHELKVFAFDFFSTINTYTAHRNVAKYFMLCREKLDYTECHLGMAAYGPQFQREVMNNHPTDIGYDSSKFSADWCTFLAFRRSRAEFQKQWDYLSPEYGMMYMLTHYSNWGHPRTYKDPEPQQLMYEPHAYCAIGYNFHDLYGFRSSIATVAAFSSVYIFGHLDMKTPEADIKFAREYIQWVAQNADVIKRSRVCYEDNNSCVVSKIHDGKGIIFLINYATGERTFKIKLFIGETTINIRQVFPIIEPTIHKIAEGDEFTVTVKGEGIVILDVNAGIKTLPPENRTQFPVDIKWINITKGMAMGTFLMPDIATKIRNNIDLNLPKHILSIEQVNQPTVVGLGKLSDGFKRAYEMEEDKLIETWKLAPWAYANRVWFMYRPNNIEYQADDDVLPKLEINGTNVVMVPRINYHKGLECLLFFADITSVVKYGVENSVRLTNLKESEPGYAGIYCAADRF